MNVHVNVLRVFNDHDGNFGNPVGIVVDEEKLLTPEDRQKVAMKLNFSETVYLDSLVLGKTSIYNPTSELKFAAHALVGTFSFLTSSLKRPVLTVQSPAGHVATFSEGEHYWIRVTTAYSPPWNFEEYSDAGSVGVINPNHMRDKNHTVVWAWIDKNKGLIRARTFAFDWGILEDEANGSGALLLAAKLNRDLKIRHGKGSVIFARPVSSEFTAVGGRVVTDPPVEVSL